VLVVPNDVAIGPEPGIEIRSTLEGVTVADLRALVVRHAGASARA
jgi:hypothetical protein